MCSYQSLAKKFECKHRDRWQSVRLILACFKKVFRWPGGATSLWGARYSSAGSSTPWSACTAQGRFSGLQVRDGSYTWDISGVTTSTTVSTMSERCVQAAQLCASTVCVLLHELLFCGNSNTFACGYCYFVPLLGGLLWGLQSICFDSNGIWKDDKFLFIVVISSVRSVVLKLMTWE